MLAIANICRGGLCNERADHTHRPHFARHYNKRILDDWKVPRAPSTSRRRARKATSLNFSGVSLGTVARVQDGTLVGEAFSWQMAFGLATAITQTVVAALMAAMPSLNPTHQNKFGDGGDVSKCRKSR